MPQQFVIPNPYLSDTGQTAARASLMFGMVNATAFTVLTNPDAARVFTTAFVGSLIDVTVEARPDESEEVQRTRAARAALWSLALAARSFADQGFSLVTALPALPDDCDCGVNHAGHRKLYAAFFEHAADGHPDSAVGQVVSALNIGLHQPSSDGLLYRGVGPMSQNHGERFFLSCLIDHITKAVARKMFTPYD